MISSSPKEFRSRAKRAFLRANPEVTSAVFHWQHCQRVAWFDGTEGYSGVAYVSAPGYRSRAVVASETDDAISVR